MIVNTLLLCALASGASTGALRATTAAAAARRELGGDCSDSASWYHRKKESKNCAWVKEKDSRCTNSKLKSNSKVAVWEACQLTCGSCSTSDEAANACGDRVDDANWIFKKSSKKNCDWVAQKVKRCKKTDSNNIKASEACAKACCEEEAEDEKEDESENKDEHEDEKED